MAKPPISLATRRKEPRPTQKELDQAATIDTFRRILAAIVRKHGVLDVMHVSTKDIQALATGDMRVRDDIKPGHITLSIRDDPKAKQPFMGPKLVV